MDRLYAYYYYSDIMSYLYANDDPQFTENPFHGVIFKFPSSLEASEAITAIVCNLP